jgi:predicted transcriptional regulator
VNRLPAEKRALIGKLAASKHTLREIAREVGVSRETVTTYGFGNYRRQLFQQFQKVVQVLIEMGIEDPFDVKEISEFNHRLGWQCHLHPEAEPDIDIDPDTECSLCVSDGLKRHHERRKEEGRPIVPPRKQKKMENHEDNKVEPIESVRDLYERPKIPPPKPVRIIPQVSPSAKPSTTGHTKKSRGRRFNSSF